MPDEEPIAEMRARLQRLGLRPFSLPLAVNIDRWLAGGHTPWDTYPDTNGGKLDAETASLGQALRHNSVSLHTGTTVEDIKLAPDGRHVAALQVRHDGAIEEIKASLFIVSASAVNSAALLLRSTDSSCPAGVANRSGVVGRHSMNHNCTAMLVIDPRRRNNSIYQKTLG